MASNVYGNWRVGCLFATGAVVWFLLLVRTFGWDLAFRVNVVLYILLELRKLRWMAHQSGTRAGAFTIVTALVAALVFAWSMLVWDVRWWIRWLLAPCLAAPLYSMANASYRADVRRAQQLRDAHAARLTERVLAGERVEPFILYLRPFVTANRLPAVAQPQDHTEVQVHLDLETLFARAFRATMPVIALGPVGDMMERTARSVVSDDKWREAVQALSRQAEFITMVPLPSQGTMWELEWVKQQDLVGKVLFVMPETPYQTPRGVVPVRHADRPFDSGVWLSNAALHEIDLTTAWLEAERATRGLGLEFPPLASVGALYTIAPTGTVKGIIPLGLTTSRLPLHYLHASVARLGLLPAPAAPTSPLGLLPTPAAPTSLIEALEKFTTYDARTRDFALTRAADGFAAWGDVTVAMTLIHRALEIGRPGGRFVTYFIEQLPHLIDQRVATGDARAASNYRVLARLVLADSELAKWASIGELSRRLAGGPSSTGLTNTRNSSFTATA